MSAGIRFGQSFAPYAQKDDAILPSTAVRTRSRRKRMDVFEDNQLEAQVDR